MTNKEADIANNQVPFFILPIIVFSQFACTSIWFATNAVMDQLVLELGIASNALSYLTSAVQIGFIFGTLVFAFSNLSDRFSSSWVFFICALLGALSNLLLVLVGHSLFSLIGLRISTGFFLAGIYPVGMKIASDYYNSGLGRSLGYLVGALVLGTALPHFIQYSNTALDWRITIRTLSIMAVLGGLSMVIFVKDGPYNKSLKKVKRYSLRSLFIDQKFRGASVGYFGHMWELYTLWAFTPLIVERYLTIHGLSTNVTSLYSFLIIGIGALACVASGYLAQSYSTIKIARYSLLGSLMCCLLSPLVFFYAPLFLFVGFMLIWGMLVIADSPLFSTLVAQNAPIELKGSALTAVTCIGFSITIISIQLVGWITNYVDIYWAISILAIGPIWGWRQSKELAS